jgi:hypothetical protein
MLVVAIRISLQLPLINPWQPSLGQDFSRSSLSIYSSLTHRSPNFLPPMTLLPGTDLVCVTKQDWLLAVEVVEAVNGFRGACVD